jgi:predicted outer membrane protein
VKLQRYRIKLLMVCGFAGLQLAAACAVPQNNSTTGNIPTSGNNPPATANSAEQVSANDTWPTQWGSLSAADRDLISKVRLASLWEMPMAQQAAQRAQSPRVRQISAEIAAQHMVLDQQVRTIARRLKVTLPTEPTTLQKEWMQDISSRTGQDYDATYVKWLRLAHGQVFALIGSVRGSTQNSLVRAFAEAGNKAVLNHQRLLESTGLTTPEGFPTPPTVTPPAH